MLIDIAYVRAALYAAARRLATKHAAFCSAQTTRGYIALLPR